MKIGRTWQIRSDSMNVVLSKRRVRVKKETGEKYEDWEDAGYFPDIAGALKFLVAREVRDTELKDLKAINDRITQLEKTIDAALSEPESHAGAGNLPG